MFHSIMLQQANNSSVGVNDSLGMNATCGQRGETVVFVSEAYIQPLLLFIGILTNSASLIILPGSRIATTFKLCLVALALSDFCATTTGFIQMLVEVIAYGGNMPFGYWEDPAVASYSLYFTYMLFMCTSAGLVILIVVLRSFIVSRPVTARRVLTKRVTRLLCWGVFIVTALLYSPTILNILWQSCYRDNGPNGKPFCIKLFEDIPDIEKIANTYLYFMSVLYGPVLVLVYFICFIAIKVSLNKTTKMLEALTQRKDSIHHGNKKHGSKKKQLSRTAKITRTLLVILVLDTICTLPMVIQGIGLIVAPTTTVFNKENCWYSIFDVFAEVALCFRPTYNFWLYVHSHKEFRDRCHYQLRRLQYFCCKGVCKLDQKPRESHSSVETHSGTGSNLRTLTPDRGSRTSVVATTDSEDSEQQQDLQTPKKSRRPTFKRQGSWTRMMLLKAAFKGSSPGNQGNSDHGNTSRHSNSNKKDLTSVTYIAAEDVADDTAV